MVSENVIEGVVAEADDLLIAAMNEDALPGLAVGIVHDGELIHAKGLGMADGESKRPVTPDTVFRIGSISKTFTAIGLMQLWEQGRFQLDDPISGYLKSYKLEHRDPNAPPVTFRHLLTHTAGIGEFRTISDLARFRSTFALGVKEGEPVPALDEYYNGRVTPELYPGEKWAYANHGFAALGQLVEDISGEIFEQYMLRHVLEPLGMFHTDYLRSERVRDQLATGYGSKKGLPTPVKYHEIAVRPAGSIFSSVNDMAMYLAALMNGGANQHGSIIKPETLRMMMEPHYRLDERLPAMGLAFWLDSIGGHRTAGHGGGWPGFVSAMHVAPDDGLGVIAFTNTNSLALDAIVTDLMRRMLDVPEAAVRLPRTGILESPHLWHELCGFYGPKPGLLTNARVWMAFGGEAEVLVKGNHLAVRSLVGPAAKGLRLYPVDPTDPLLFRTELEKLPVPIAFKRDDAGRVDRMCVAGLGFTTVYKRPRKESLRFRATAALAGLAALAGALVLRKLRRR